MSMQGAIVFLKNTGIRSATVLLSAAVIAAACSGSSSDPGGPVGAQEEFGITPISPVDDYPNSAFPGPDEPPLLILKPGQGSIKGFINTPGDVDFFRMDLVGGRLYNLEVSNFPVDFQNGPIDNSLTILFLDAAGVLTEELDLSLTSRFNWPAGLAAAGLAPGDGNSQYAWITPYSGKYHFAIGSAFTAAIGEYEFRLSGSELGVGLPRQDAVSNRRSHQIILDGDGNILWHGPTPHDRLEGQPLFYLEGTLGHIQLTWSGTSFTGDGWLSVLTLPSFIVPEVLFFDTDGTLNDTPEVPALHLHWGTPSHDFSDATTGFSDVGDDTLWNFDPLAEDPSGIFLQLPLGPDDSLPGGGFSPAIGLRFIAPNLNFQPGGGDPHPFVADFIAVPELDNPMIHLFMGNSFYTDLHFHSQFAYDSRPLVSSFPQNGFSMFDSRLVLNGFETVPPTGVLDQLEVYYNAEHQVFYLQYDYDAGILKGMDIHVHSGRPGEVGPVIVDLGTVPFLVTRPNYEPEFLPLGPNNTYRFWPNVENIIKRITNEEAIVLGRANFSTGWYIDVHTPPQFTELDHPAIRSDAILHDNLEVIATEFVSLNTTIGSADADDSSAEDSTP